MEMRVEHDVRAALGRPTHSLRIAPTLVADHDPKFQRTDLENLPARTVAISAFLKGIELDFVLALS